MICSVCHEISKLPRALNISITDARHTSKAISIGFLAKILNSTVGGGGSGEWLRGVGRERERERQYMQASLLCYHFKESDPTQAKLKSCSNWPEASDYEDCI